MANQRLLPPVIATGDGGMHTTTADMALFWTALLSGRIVRVETLADMRTARSEPYPGESRCYGLGLWLKADSPQITMSGGDAGVSFWSSHHPERGTTATVISTTLGAPGPWSRSSSHKPDPTSARWSNHATSLAPAPCATRTRSTSTPGAPRGRVGPLDRARESGQQGVHSSVEAPPGRPSSHRGAVRVLRQYAAHGMSCFRCRRPPAIVKLRFSNRGSGYRVRGSGQRTRDCPRCDRRRL
jgi:CubicO group peptidase (beta-lactamase class C family)